MLVLLRDKSVLVLCFMIGNATVKWLHLFLLHCLFLEEHKIIHIKVIDDLVSLRAKYIYRKTILSPFLACISLICMANL